jgi:hypothetical protein
VPARSLASFLRPVATALSLSLLVGPTLATGQAPDAIHREIQETYGFSPHQLSAAQIEEKSRLLDRFWNKAQAQREVYLPALRAELIAFATPGFFLYDGSSLLLKMSDEASDRRIALAAIARCDLRDVHSEDYFHRVHGLAVSGEDTSDAGLHILEDPEFRVVVPQHALTLGQNYSLVYMLLPVDPQRWLGKVIGRLAGGGDVTAQKSLLLMLWYAQSKESDDAIAAVAKDGGRPDAVRGYARELLAAEGNVSGVLKALSLLHSEEGLRADQKKLMSRVSDEALIELDHQTLLLVAKRH